MKALLSAIAMKALLTRMRVAHARLIAGVYPITPYQF